MTLIDWMALITVVFIDFNDDIGAEVLKVILS